MGLFDQQSRKLSGKRALGSEGAFIEYAQAYLKAARSLLQPGRLDAEGPPNYSVFPAAYLYRHALESAIKGLLLEYRTEVKNHRRSKDILKHGHQLGKLIKPLKELKQVYPAEFEEAETGDMTFTALEALLREWDTNDPYAVMFRYGTGKKVSSRSTLPRPNFLLNMSEFAPKMDAAIEYVLNVYGNIFSTISREIEREIVGALDEEAD